MLRPYFHLPFKPFYITQKWGVENPIYQQFGFSRHNGIDAKTGSVIFPIYTPFPAQVVNIGYHPKGSGILLTMLSDETFDFLDGRSARILLDFLHLKATLVPIRHRLKVGEISCYADNTGFSTGPHTHIQPRRVKGEYGSLEFIDTNDAHGSFDITFYSTGKYAQDLATFGTNVNNLQRQVQYFYQVIKK